MADKSDRSLRDTAETFPSKLPDEEKKRQGQADENRDNRETVIFGPDNRPLGTGRDMETGKELHPKTNDKKDLLTEKDQDYVPNLKRLADIDVDYQGKKK